MKYADKVIRYSRLSEISEHLAARQIGSPLTVRQRLQLTAALLGSVGVVLASSFFWLIHKSLRLDESQSIWQVSHSLRGMYKVVGNDVHVPLYHTLLHYWIFAFGDGVTTVRLLSLIFFIASIPLVYLIARQLLSFRWSVFAMVLFSVSPFMNWYGNEARMYTLLVFMSLLSQYFFLKIMRNGKGWFAFGLTAMIGVYSHYFFLFNLAAIGLYFLANLKKFKPGSLKRMIAVAVLCAASLSPWLYYVYTLGLASNTRPMLPTPSTIDFFNAFSQFLFGFQSNFLNTILLSSWPLLLLLGLVAVRRYVKLPDSFLFLGTMAVLPVLLAYGVSLLVTPFFLSRYMIAAVPPLIIILLWFFSQYARRAAIAVIAVIIVLTGVFSYQQAFSQSNPVAENYRGAADYILSNGKPQDVIVLSSPFTIYPFSYYYNGNLQIHTLPEWQRNEAGAIPAFNPRTLPEQVAAQNKNHRYVYLLLSQDQGYEDTINQYYKTHFKQVSQKVYSEDLTLYVYQVGFYTVPSISDEQSKIILPADQLQ